MRHVKHVVWGGLAITTLVAIVLLSIFAEGAHVELVAGFGMGLLVPGSPFDRGAGGGGAGAGRAPRGAVAATAGVLLLVVSWMPGCGGATTEQRTAYAVEQARCIANERAIVDRGGTSYEEDRADLDAERARCDAALRAIYPGGS